MSVATRSEAEIWHDVENGAYRADLPLWRELAARAGGPVLELGCGTGRVALDLARAGHEVRGIDTSAPLVKALERIARAEGLSARAVVGDVREDLEGGPFALIAAPMQVIQLLGGPADRARALEACARALAPGGIVATAIAVDVPSFAAGEAVQQPLPDVAEVDGSIYSSLPLAVESSAERVRIERLRQRVDPEGALTEEVAEEILQTVTADTLEAEGEACGLRARARMEIAPTDDHLGSIVVVLEAGS